MCTIAAVAAGGVVTAGAPAFAATPTGFTAGDLVIYQANGDTSTSYSVSLVDYSTTGVASGFSVDLPSSNGGGNYELTESGSASFDGELSLSGDGQSLLATGYTAGPGVTKITSATNTPRTVAIVSSSGSVDTTTSLSDATTEGNNFRSAVTAVGGGTIWVGGGGGVGVTTDGGSSATYLNSDNVHDVQVVGSQLYESTATAINAVGSGLPASGSPSDTTLVGGTNAPSGFEPA
ncbi:MAG TPA: hypothetical protein VMD59_09635, partial [Acidimicrobiales bacterium]|nr:hypothetical protein [Acidimicrobiales bacterium]